MRSAGCRILFAAFSLVIVDVARADPEEGRKLFVRACATCHAVEPGAAARAGPNLHGVTGRKAASLPDFKYSEALKAADITWTEAALDPWLENPKAVLAGTSMLYRQADPEKRKLLIAYLKTLGGPQGAAEPSPKSQ